MKLEGQNILIISNEAWGPFWYSKHNYAFELSKKNKVFFLDPPVPFRLSNFFRNTVKEKKISPTLTVLEYNNIYPVSLLNLWKRNDQAILKALRNYFQKKNIGGLLFWTFDPIRLGFPETLHPEKIILHAVDDYLFTYPSERLLAGKADVIICVSEKIAENYKSYSRNVHVIGHAIPDDEFLPEKVKEEYPLTGIFIGKIDKRIDFEFSLEIFRSFPEVSFKIIGSADPEFRTKIESLALKNVSIFPPVPSHRLRYELQTADFCFIFKRIYKGNNIFSHKLLQYLAQGKPVFATEFSDVDNNMKSAMYLSNDLNEVKTMLSKFIKEGEEQSKIAARIAYAKKNTFSKAIASIEKFLN